ncbi:MAG: hypothetical protein WAU60_05195 [Candidatus Competibacter denitrificans]
MKAEAQGNRDLIALYQKQISKLQTLYDLKAQNLKRDQETDKKTTTTTAPSSNTSGGSTESGGGGKSGGNTTNITINTDITNLANEDWVRKNIIPTLSKVAGLRR